MTQIRLLLVDDHRLVAQALQLGLAREPDLEVVGVAGTAGDGLAMAAELRPDVVLLDFHLPDQTGAEAAARLRELHPATRVVFLSADESEEALLAAVEAGACGYLIKSEPLERVARAVRRAAEGEILLEPATLLKLMEHRRRLAREEAQRERLLGRLTQREREVIDLMAEGLDNRTIAEDLGISLTTTRWYVQNVLEKLDSHSKLEAVARAAEMGIIRR